MFLNVAGGQLVCMTLMLYSTISSVFTAEHIQTQNIREYQSIKSVCVHIPSDETNLRQFLQQT